MDHDQARNNKRAEAMLESFRSGGADILIGTQMIAKGLHFPGLTLVVVVSADTFLNFPDFRAEERTFQLLVQVAGRAGRGEKPGRVILQTMRAQRPALQLAAQQDYARFYEQEIIARQELGYPPFGKLASLRVSGRQPERVVSAAHTLAAALRSARLPETEILGPAPFYYEKIKRDHRYHVFVRSRQHAGRQQLVARARALVLPSGVHLAVDIDPQNML
jgi:primosomal protein N' (replication factor Y)